MRLIDADRLLKEFEPDGEAIDPITVRMKIVQAPTAYNVGKVVEHIEKGNRMIEESLEVPVDEVQRFMYEIQLYTANNIIDVIKAGGTDENKKDN